MADIDNSPWNASEAWHNGATSDNPEAFYRAICAGEKTSGDPATQAHWALPHHYHPGDAPNAAGVRNSLSRISQTQGLSNKSAAQKHLDNHMADIHAAEKDATPASQRAARVARFGNEIPCGTKRERGFPSEIRAKLVTKDGRQVYEVEGYATVWNRGYEMWDAFGSYTEIMDSTALDKSLGRGPDVAFLVNHRGVTMARTVNGSMVLEKDSTGLHVDASLNADRQDVRDLASAIADGLVDEMSFAFMLNDGEWDDDFETFRITEADINRGDVSAVNYGANPHTSIMARSADWLADIERVPEPVARAAFDRINRRLNGVGQAGDANPAAVDEIVRTAENAGKSLKIWRMRLDHN